ncbi:MAG TPA: FAD-dependent oxidoreductase, partial [Burkholderiaceae bacterium]|nr:FAD-dependent oxidoreductase [Burkholderiaceae bacterium]
HQPVIGTSPTTPGLIHAFGFCGAGFQIGPAVGEALAEFVHRGRTSVALAAFSIARFAGSTTTAFPLASQGAH